MTMSGNESDAADRIDLQRFGIAKSVGDEKPAASAEVRFGDKFRLRSYS
jgi:hypothetical protein